MQGHNADQTQANAVVDFESVLFATQKMVNQT